MTQTMDFPATVAEPAASASAGRTTKLLRALALLPIIGLYAALQWSIFLPAYGEGDCDGYVTLAKRMAHGGPLGVVDTDPFMHQTHVWVQNARGEVLPKFAPGFAGLLAVVWKFTHSDVALFLVSPVLGGLTLIGAYLLFRQWTRPLAAWFATLALVVNAQLIFYQSYLLAHAAEICFVTWGMYFLWKWMGSRAVEGQYTSRNLHAGAERVLMRRPGFFDAGYEESGSTKGGRGGWDVFFGIAAGLALGYAAALRHTAVLLALCVLVAAITQLFRRGRRLAPIVALLLGYAIFPALVGLYDWHYFGAPWRTGYDLSGEQISFSYSDFADHADMLAEGLNGSLFFILFPIGLVGALCLGSWRERAIKWLWILPAFLVYSAYYWALPGTAYYRFMWPVAAMIVGSAFMLIDRVRAPRRTVVAMMIVIVLLITWHGRDSYAYWWGYQGPDEKHPWRQKPNGLGNNQNAIPMADAAAALDAAVRDDHAVIFAADQAHNALGVHRDYQTYALSSFTPEAGVSFRRKLNFRSGDCMMQQSRRTWLADFYEHSTAEQLRARQRQIITDAQRDGREVVFFVPAQRLGEVQQYLKSDFETSLIQEAHPRAWGTWEIIEVKPKPATVRPTTAPATP